MNDPLLEEEQIDSIIEAMRAAQADARNDDGRLWFDED